MTEGEAIALAAGKRKVNSEGPDGCAAPAPFDPVGMDAVGETTFPLIYKARDPAVTNARGASAG